jgi:hypothetical protein
MYDDIVAIATELGTNPSGTGFTTLNGRIGVFETAWTESMDVDVDQGTSTNIAHTTNYGAWRRVADGPTGTDGGFEAIVDVTFTGTGASGQVKFNFTGDLATASGPHGWYMFYDVSATRMYVGPTINSGSSWADMWCDAGLLGSASPAFQIANGDRLWLWMGHDGVFFP